MIMMVSSDRSQVDGLSVVSISPVSSVGSGELVSVEVKKKTVSVGVSSRLCGLHHTQVHVPLKGVGKPVRFGYQSMHFRVLWLITTSNL